MPKSFNNESNYPEYSPSFDEFGAPPRDYERIYENPSPAEEAYSLDEHNSAPGVIKAAELAKEESERTRRRLKDYVVKPLVSVITVAGVTLTSFGIDLLGMDLLNNSALVMEEEWFEHYREEYEYHRKEEEWYYQDENRYEDEDYKDEPHENENYLPQLENPEPDYDGQYAWSDLGPELFLRVTQRSKDGESCTYFVKGEAWAKSDPECPVAERINGAYYDKGTNVLTLENFSGGTLEANLMGNSFTVRLIGENELESVVIWGAEYAGSITFEGDGILRVTHGGLRLNAERSPSCLMVKGGVTLEISALENEPAIVIYETTMATGVYFGGSAGFGEGVIFTAQEYTPEDNKDLKLYTHYTATPNGEVVSEVRIGG